jgi:hypothetical protein
MASTINAITTGAGGIVTTGDSTGNISLQSNGTSVLAATASGVDVTGTFTVNGSALNVSGGATTTSSAVDITLTSSSNRVQDVTMTAADKSVILPSATTLSLGGPIFIINNRGGRDFYIKNNGGVIIAVVKPFASVQLSLTANGTANGTWAKQDGDIFFGQYLPSQVTTDKSYLYTTQAYANSGALFSNNTNGVISVKKISSTTALILWANPIDVTNNSLTNLKAVVATVSSGSITYGTAVTVYTGTTTGLANFGAVVLSSTAALVIVDKTGANASSVYPLVLSGSTITVGTSVNVPSGATSGYRYMSDICYLSSTTAMISYVGNAAATNGLRAVTITHNGSSAPTASSAVVINANIGTANKLIPLTSTTCQLIYQTASATTLSTVIVTSTGASTAPTLGTAIVTSYSAYVSGTDLNYGIIGYAYSSTETAAIVGNNIQISFTISGTTITEQAFTNLWAGNNNFTSLSNPWGSIAWFNSTQGIYLRSNGCGYNGLTTNFVPVSYTVGTGINIGDSNIVTPTINGYGLGAIDQLDSTTAIAVIPYAKGLQAEIVTLL